MFLCRIQTILFLLGSSTTIAKAEEATAKENDPTQFSDSIESSNYLSSSSEVHAGSCRNGNGDTSCPIPSLVQQQDRVSSSSSSSSYQSKSDSQAENSDSSRPFPILECGLFMAPSTLTSTAEVDNHITNSTTGTVDSSPLFLGMYTGISLQRDDVIGSPEIVIPLLYRTMDYVGDGDGSVWDRYIWEGTIANIESYTSTNADDSKAVFVPGLGSAINSLLDMYNVHSTSGSSYDTVGLSRLEPNDIGVGAFSPYHSSKTIAARNIPAGSELFANYGQGWIPSIPNVAITQTEYLNDGNDFVHDVWDWMQTIKSHHPSASNKVLEGIWKFVTNPEIGESPILTILPQNVTWNQVDKVIQTSRTQTHEVTKDSCSSPSNSQTIHNQELLYDDDEKDDVLRRFIRNKGRRSLEWLHEHGTCQDHMRPGISTIPQAGRGVFATRNLPKDSIVGHAPLLHIAQDGLKLWNVTYPSSDETRRDRTNDSTSSTRNTNGYSKLDLIINYSFGHSQSTILLTPYGSMVNYINHNGNNPNVKISWPTKPSIHHRPHWLHEDLDYLKNTINTVGLSFDFVALRDIEQGEEIVMDYGKDWENAWEEHGKQWKAYSSHSYVHSSQYSLDYYRTEKELANNSYPSNLQTMCVESYRLDPKQRQGQQSHASSNKDHTDSSYIFVPILRATPHRVHCTVLERIGGSAPSSLKHQWKSKNQPSTSTTTTATSGSPSHYLYTVEMITSNGARIQVRQVTNNGIFLVDKPFSQDWHLPNAFRHPIGIPNDIFPDSWKNIL